MDSIVGDKTLLGSLSPVECDKVNGEDDNTRKNDDRKNEENNEDRKNDENNDDRKSEESDDDSTTSEESDESFNEIHKPVKPIPSILRNLEAISIDPEDDEELKNKHPREIVYMTIRSFLRIALMGNAIVVLYVLGKNLVSSKNCYRLPDYTYYCWYEFTFLGVSCGWSLSSLTHCIFRRPMRLNHLWQKSLYIGSFHLSLVLVPWAGCFMRDGSVVNTWRSACIPISMIVLWFIMKRSAKTSEVPHRVDSSTFRKQNNQLCVAAMRGLMALWIGFYLVLKYVTEWFPMIQARIQSGIDTDTGFGGLVLMCAEAFLAFFFFSVLMPIWHSTWSKQMYRIISFYPFRDADKKIGMRQSIVYNEDESIQFEKMSSLMPENTPYINPAILDRLMLLINFAQDCVRYTYGRGFLFKLSSFYLFYAIMWKDLCYAFLHFGLKYTEWVVTFTVKVFHNDGDGLRNVSKLWTYVIKIIELTVRFMGIPKSIARCWEPVCDFHQLEIDDEEQELYDEMWVPPGLSGAALSGGFPFGIKSLTKEEEAKFKNSDYPRQLSVRRQSTANRRGSMVRPPIEKTGLGLRLTFCNVAIRIHNLPKQLKEDVNGMLDRDDELYDERDLDPFGVEDDILQKKTGKNTMQSAANAIRDAIESGIESGDSPVETPGETSENHTNSAANTAANHYGMIGTAAALDNQILEPPKKKVKLPPGTGTILESIKEEPVSPVEMERLRHVISFIQKHIFIRYQVRATVKFGTSMLFLLVPLVGSLSQASLSPKFNNPYDLDKPETRAYWIAGCSWFVLDILEWFYFTRFYVQRSKDMRGKGKYFYKIVHECKPGRIAMVNWVACFGMFLINVLWNPWQSVDGLNYPQTNVPIDYHTIWAHQRYQGAEALAASTGITPEAARAEMKAPYQPHRPEIFAELNNEHIANMKTDTDKWVRHFPDQLRPFAPGKIGFQEMQYYCYGLGEKPEVPQWLGPIVPEDFVATP